MKITQKYTREECERLRDIRKKINELKNEYEKVSNEIMKSHNLLPIDEFVYFYFCDNWREKEINNVRIAYLDRWTNHDTFCSAELRMVSSEGNAGNYIDTTSHMYDAYGGIIGEIEPVTESFNEAQKIIKKVKADLKRDKAKRLEKFEEEIKKIDKKEYTF